MEAVKIDISGETLDEIRDSAISALYQLTTQVIGVTLTGVKDSHRDIDKGNAAVIAMGAAFASLEIVAKITSENIPEKVSDDQMLFAAMLFANSYSLDRNPDKRGFTVEVGPLVISRTLEMFEKATGRNIDHLLCSGLLESGRNKQKLDDHRQWKNKTLN
jgi:hypothetical protein